jgi:uncharacterized membrane protein
MELLKETVHWIGIVIELMAVFTITWASGEAFLRVLRLLFRHASGEERRDIYLRYLRWLVAGLTFQLAADLVHIAIATTWESLGHVAAIAVIRTFLSYFLDRDLRHTERE